MGNIIFFNKRFTKDLHKMPKKRRNNGRNKKGRGKTKRVPCMQSGKLIPKDKSIKRYVVRDLFDASTKSDINDNKAVDTITIPKIFIKQYYSIEAAIHKRIVRVRQKADRRYRGPPQQVVERR